jgi:hypothetical protein
MQLMQAALAGSPVPVWKVPAMHWRHALEIVAPEVVEYCPVPQSVQADEAARPSPVWKVPATHLAQSAASLSPSPVW